MGSFKARQLLLNTAFSYQSQRESFSRIEIVKKINEIKYLSAQKKVPKLTLRKEIIHLENKLQSIFKIEKALLAQKKRESSKIARLKKENASLKKQLAASKDQDLHKKVGKLTHLLGENLAKKEVKENVKLDMKIKDELEKKTPPMIDHPTKIKLPPPLPTTDHPPIAQPTESLPTRIARFTALKAHLAKLKAELQIHKDAKNEPKVTLLKQEIQTFENKLRAYAEKHPEVGSLDEAKVIRETPVKHTILMGNETPMTLDEKEAELELPLPPPPRMG